MATSISGSTGPTKTSFWQTAVIRAAQMSVYFIIMSATLFLAAGRLDWWEAWLFLAVYYLIALATALWMLYTDPDLSNERARFKTEAKSWDKVIVGLNLVLTLSLLAVLGLDAGRFGWSDVSAVIRFIALLGFIPAFGLPIWSAHVNTYLSGQVRIQEERGHLVITEGPYQYVRHPMYVGMIFYDLSLPLLLGSWWGLVVGSSMVTVVIVRTILEDRNLQNELPGYADYARRVPSRLIPRVW